MGRRVPGQSGPKQRLSWISRRRLPQVAVLPPATVACASRVPSLREIVRGRVLFGPEGGGPRTPPSCKRLRAVDASITAAEGA